jgi:hypothetical protein
MTVDVTLPMRGACTRAVTAEAQPSSPRPRSKPCTNLNAEVKGNIMNVALTRLRRGDVKREDRARADEDGSDGQGARVPKRGAAGMHVARRVVLIPARSA